MRRAKVEASLGESVPEKNKHMEALDGSGLSFADPVCSTINDKQF